MSDPRLPQIPFVETMPMVLLRTREALMEGIRTALRRHDLTDQQWRVLRVLAASGPLEMAELARLALIQPPNLTRLVRSMAGRGLLSRAPHPQDRRIQVVAVAEAGNALIDTLAPVLVGQGRELREAYGAEELDRLRQMLLKLIDAAGTAGDD